MSITLSVLQHISSSTPHTTHTNVAGASSAITPVTHLADTNPFNGIVPNFSLGGAKFNSLWKKLLGFAWGVSIIVCAFHLFPSLLSMRRNKRLGNAASLSDSTQELQIWGLSTIGVLLAGVLFGAMLYITQ